MGGALPLLSMSSRVGSDKCLLRVQQALSSEICVRQSN